MLYKGSKEDDLLTNDGQSLFVDQGYVRTANWGAEYVDLEANANSNPQFGQTLVYQLDSIGDLMGQIDLLFKATVKCTPGTAGQMNFLCRDFGYAMLEKVWFAVNSNIIQEFGSEDLRRMNELEREDRWRQDKLFETPRGVLGGISTSDVMLEAGWAQIGANAQAANYMAAKTTADGNDYVTYNLDYNIPLPFWFCGKYGPGYYFPMKGVTNAHDVRIYIKLRDMSQLAYSSQGPLKHDNGVTLGHSWLTGMHERANITNYGSLPENAWCSDIQASNGTNVAENVSSKLRINYYHLPKPEADLLRNVETTRIIEDIQFQDMSFVLDSANHEVNFEHKQMKLNFLHPVKELVIMLKRDTATYGPNALWDHDSGSTHDVGGVLSGGRRKRSHGMGGTAVEIAGLELSLNGTKTNQNMIDRDHLLKRILPLHHQNQYSGAEVNYFVIPLCMHPDRLLATSGHINFSKVAHPNLNIYLKHAGSAGTVTVEVYARTYNWMAMRGGKCWKVFH